MQNTHVDSHVSQKKGPFLGLFSRIYCGFLELPFLGKNGFMEKFNFRGPKLGHFWVVPRCVVGTGFAELHISKKGSAPLFRTFSHFLCPKSGELTIFHLVKKGVSKGI